MPEHNRMAELDRLIELEGGWKQPEQSQQASETQRARTPRNLVIIKPWMRRREEYLRAKERARGEDVNRMDR